MLDWLINPLKWITDITLGFATLLSTTYGKIVEQIIELLFAAALPTPEKLANNWFKLGLGATYGLAGQIMGLVAIVIGILVILRPLKNHGTKLSRVISSIVLVLLFGILFYPVYGMLYSLSQGLTQAVLNIATSSPTGSAATLIDQVKLVLPEDPFGKLVTVCIALACGFTAFIEALALQIALFLLLMFYPLNIALRPLGGLPRFMLNFSNAGIVTVLVSPPIMGIGFALPVLVKSYIPGGSLSFTTALLTVVGGVFAVVMPLVIAIASYRSSKEIFGSVEASVAGKLDINSIPPVTLDDARKDAEEANKSTLRTITSTVQVADLADDDLMGNIKRTAVKGSAAIATITGHPEAATAITAVDSYLNSRPKKPTNPKAN